MSQKEKKRMTGLRLAGEIRQYKKDALLSPLFTILCVILEILIPYKTAAIIDEGIAVGDMGRVAVIGAQMLVMALLAAVCGVKAGQHSARASTGFSTAGLVTRMTTDVSNVQNAFQMMLMMFTRAPVTLIVALFMALSINAKLSMIFLVVMAVLGVMLFVFVPSLTASTSFMIIPSGAMAIGIAYLLYKKGART